MKETRLILFFCFLSLTRADLVTQLTQCLETPEQQTVNCLKLIVNSLKFSMKTGIPEAGIPPLDPLKLDNVGFSLAGSRVEFMNITLRGLGDHTVDNVEYEEENRILKLSLAIEKLRSSGNYSLTGKVLNIDGLDSSGPYKNEYSGIRADGVGNIVKVGNKIQIDELKIKLKINNIKVHMECLFPKPGGPACCDRDRKFRSCNPIFAKTIHRTINTKTGGTSSIVERFQSEITDKVAEITTNFMNSALSQVDPKYFF